MKRNFIASISLMLPVFVPVAHAHIVQVTHLESKETGQHVVLLGDCHVGSVELEKQHLAELITFFTEIDKDSPFFIEYDGGLTSKTEKDLFNFCHISTEVSEFCRKVAPSRYAMISEIGTALSGKRSGGVGQLDMVRPRLVWLLALPVDPRILQANRTADEMDAVYREFFHLRPDGSLPMYIAHEIELAIDACAAHASESLRLQIVQMRSDFEPFIQKLKQAKRVEDLTQGFLSALSLVNRLLGAFLAPLFDIVCVEAVHANKLGVVYVLTGSGHVENIEKMLGDLGFVRADQEIISSDIGFLLASSTAVVRLKACRELNALFRPVISMETVFNEAVVCALLCARDSKGFSDKFFETIKFFIPRLDCIDSIKLRAIAAQISAGADLYAKAKKVVSEEIFYADVATPSRDLVSPVLPVLKRIKAEIDAGSVPINISSAPQI